MTPGAVNTLVPGSYTTGERDVLDYIVWRHYGHQDPGTVEMVLEANHGVCEYGPLLPEGLVLVLPALPPKPKRSTKLLVRFWQ